MTGTDTATPRILRVETGRPPKDGNALWAGQLDYGVYDAVPGWWRRIEAWLRMDLYLALRTRREASAYDLVWAGSEQLAIPLTLMGLRQPLVAIVHHVESPWKARFLRWSRIPHQWAGIGYVSPQSRDFMIRAFSLPSDRFFQFISAKLERFDPLPLASPDGPILSLGVAKRDYVTLLDALSDMPGCTTEIYAASRYGDQLRANGADVVPDWVTFKGWVSDETLADAYANARFVVIPLEPTTHAGAGATVALEAAAAGKAIIATDTDGMRSFVVDGETGLLVPPRDTCAMRHAIEALIAEPQRAHAMGRAGRRFVDSEFNPSVVHAETVRFLRDIHERRA